jgi:hypothetical protein
VKLFDSTKKKVAAITIAVGMIATAGIASAYWTAGGSGSGTAAVGTDSGVTITPVTFTGTLYPAGSVTVNFTINNSSTDTAVKVDKVVQDGPVTGLPTGCLAADFSFADVSVNSSIPASGTKTGTGTLSMGNTGTNQDNCKGAAPVLHLKVDNASI